MPDGLVDITKLRETFDVSEKLKTGRFTRALAAAGRRMREWVGDDAYDDALSETPDDETRKADLEYAEAHLVMHFAVLGINTALRPTGIVATETVEGNVTTRYLNPNEISTLQRQYLDIAEELTRPYALTDGTPGLMEIVASE